MDEIAEMKATDWSSQFYNIKQCADKAELLLRDVGRWVLNNVVAKDVIPPEMPEDVAMLLSGIGQELENIRKLENSFKDYFCINPVDKFAKGLRLTEVEFYLLLAQGILTMSGVSGKTQYKEFMYYYYQDYEKKGYIDFDAPLPTGRKVKKYGKETIKLRLGCEIEPEDVCVSSLSNEQKDYFEKHAPELFARFRKV